MRYDQKYRNYTMPRLILENYLRERPHRLKDLVLYANHGYTSLRVAKNKLKHEGRLLNDVVIMDHPANLVLNLRPLDDLRVLPAPNSKMNAQVMAKATEVTAKVLGPETPASEIKLMNRDELRGILSEFIRQGGDGKNFISAISALGALGTDVNVGPPAPLHPSERIKHLLTCMLSAEPSEVREAFARWEVQHANEALFGEAPPVPSGHDDSSPEPRQELLRTDPLPPGDPDDCPEPDEPGDGRTDDPGDPAGDIAP